MSISGLSSILTREGQECSPETLMAFSEEYGYKVSFACIVEKTMAWKYFLPGIECGGKALVFDSNLGLETISFSRDFTQVTAANCSPSIINNIKSRISYHSVDNCLAKVVDYKDLQFGDDEFDYVFIRDISIVKKVLNDEGVDSFIAEISRVTKKSGYFALGFNNNSFFSSKDIYGGLVEVNDLKRLLCRVKLVRSLHRVVKLYPNVYLFSELYGSNRIKRIFSKDTVKKILPYKYCPGAICCFGPPGKEDRSYVDSLKQVLGRRVFIDKAITGNPNSLILFVQIDGDEKIVRIPLCDASKARLQNQYDVLRQLAENYPQVGKSIPAQKKPICLKGETVYQEQMIKGTSVRAVDTAFTHCSELGYKWVHDLHVLTKRELVLDQAQVDKYFLTPLAKIKASLDGEGCCRTIDRLKKVFAQKFIDKEFFTVCFHGDYKIDNILFDKKYKEVSGVIDWDMAVYNGLPVVDLLFYSAYNKHLLDKRKSLSALIIDSTINGCCGYSDMERYLDEFCIARDELFLLGVITWVYHVVVRTTSHMKFSNRWRQENLVNPLECIEKNFFMLEQ